MKSFHEKLRAINSVGEKAWIPKSSDLLGFYDFHIEIPDNFSSFKWNEDFEYISDRKDGYPMKMRYDLQICN